MGAACLTRRGAGLRWGWKEALGGGGAPEATPHPRGTGGGPGRHRAAYRAGAGPQAEDAGLAESNAEDTQDGGACLDPGPRGPGWPAGDEGALCSELPELGQG